MYQKYGASHTFFYTSMALFISLGAFGLFAFTKWIRKLRKYTDFNGQKPVLAFNTNLSVDEEITIDERDGKQLLDSEE